MSKYLRAHGKPWIERVLTPSLSIIYPPYSNISKKVFSVLFPFPLLDEIKVGGDSCLPHICEYKTHTSVKLSVLPPYHRTDDSAGDFISKVYLRIRSLLFSIVCFNFVGLYQSSIDPNPDLGTPFR